MLPALQTLQLDILVAGQLPAEWASGFQQLETLVLSDPLCAQGNMDQALAAQAAPQAQSDSAARSRSSSSRAAAATEGPPASHWMAATATGSAESCPPMTLPPRWAGADSFPRLTRLVLEGLRLSGTIPDAWLQPGRGLASISGV